MDAKKPYSRVVFLDRDGVINKPPPVGSWILDWDEFEFADGALDALRRLREQGFTTVVATNQSCIGRGLASLQDVRRINANMSRAIDEAGGALAGIYLCPHRTEDNCSCRKPEPGLIDQAARDLALEPANAFFVGDTERDMRAGAARGCTTILIEIPGRPVPTGVPADHRVGGLAEAVDLILRLVGD